MKKWLDLAKASLPILAFALVLVERSGLIDRWCGLNYVEIAVENLSLSYAPDASTPVYPTDPAWAPLMKLIRKYSRNKLREDKQPQTVARFPATLSTQEQIAGQRISEWTSPSTPFAVLYRKWPGNSLPPEDYTVIGSIGELHEWISRQKSYFHFLVHDVVLCLLSLTLGYSVWHVAHVGAPKMASAKR